LRAVDRTLGAVDIEGHAASGRPSDVVLGQVGIEAQEPLIVPLLTRASVSNQWSVEVSAMLVSLRSREASIRNVGSSASAEVVKSNETVGIGNL
jgi:hypothetical protein